jgi:flavin-binding protein dodecin
MPGSTTIGHIHPTVQSTDHTYRVTEIVGSSHESVDAAIRNAVNRASQTLRGLAWFEVIQVRGSITDGAVGQFQVALKVGFRLEDAAT